MEFTVAILGAPNVGKSTLFNRLIGRRAILETNIPGTTRDRHYGTHISDKLKINVIDTGGWNPVNPGSLESQIQDQTKQAIEEGDVILVVFDGNAGITQTDIKLSNSLRKEKKKIVYCVNKLDNPKLEENMYEFYRLGIEKLIPVSALHNWNIDHLVATLKFACPKNLLKKSKRTYPHIKLCIAGRPNTGKSTLINALCGENRVIVNPEPGTTRDSTSICIPFDSHIIELIDTPGLRRKKKSRTPLEGLMQISTMKSIEHADIVCLLLDGAHGLTSGDARIAQMINDSNRSALILLNKWDVVEDPERTQKKIMSLLSSKIPFLRWAPVLTISAKTKLRISKILPLVDTIHQDFTRQLDESKLKKVINEAFQKHRILWRKKQLIVKNVRQTDASPPTIELEVNYPEMLHFSHKRYLENYIRENFSLEGSPLIIKTKKQKKRKKIHT